MAQAMQRHGSVDPYAVSDSTAADWDERVEHWEEVASSPIFQRLAAHLIELAAARPNDRVVDLGAGTGLLTLPLAAAVESVVAIDSSAAMLDRLDAKAKEIGRRNVDVRLADLRWLPLGDESVTLAVSNYAFHHLDDVGKELALAELRRVLAPGGRLVICDMMFSLSLRGEDRRIVADKVGLIATQGLPGMVRLAKNGWRIARGRWEKPAPPESWEQMLRRRHFVDVAVERIENEAAIATARRPS